MPAFIHFYGFVNSVKKTLMSKLNEYLWNKKVSNLVFSMINALLCSKLFNTDFIWLLIHYRQSQKSKIKIYFQFLFYLNLIKKTQKCKNQKKILSFFFLIWFFSHQPPFRRTEWLIEETLSWQKINDYKDIVTDNKFRDWLMISSTIFLCCFFV